MFLLSKPHYLQQTPMSGWVLQIPPGLPDPNSLCLWSTSQMCVAIECYRHAYKIYLSYVVLWIYSFYMNLLWFRILSSTRTVLWGRLKHLVWAEEWTVVCVNSCTVYIDYIQLYTLTIISCKICLLDLIGWLRVKSCASVNWLAITLVLQGAVAVFAIM